MDPLDYFNRELEDHGEVLAKCHAALAEPFQEMLALWVTAIQNGNKIFFFGNGGSAADAQHLAAELVIRFIEDRKPIAAIALNTDTSALTAGANDLGFEDVFARQIDALGKPGDVAVGITTSGTSPNVVKALEMARKKGLVTTAFTGRDGGRMPELTDISLIVPAQSTRRIQEMHITFGHMLCGALEQSLKLV
ncbi:D-sedoheptulose 7-phosphate isomerase [Sneathiella sp. HT1-7]|uniref:D-sedoheptulose 7-phosphate isomerase n=1 Tax=Sneathiella sp. HT1-7 TaxID=2887192 RepID=UPI001D154278|nr:D-sedoheptulose 7-phosphate isomerase [Sneathiella sp. HT1-7]MCC3303944.1 D-sedoheptulose 7-phosphate isomerase [Sneathiella sp. HT1-7]